MRHMYRPDIRQIALQSIQNLTLAGDARDENMIARHAGDHAVEPGVASHADAIDDEHILRASERRIAGEFAEWPFRLMDAGENFAFDDDLGAGGHFNIFDSTAGETIRLSEQAADDVKLPYVRRISIDHRTHIVQRMSADHDRGRQRLPPRLG